MQKSQQSVGQFQISLENKSETHRKEPLEVIQSNFSLSTHIHLDYVQFEALIE